MQQEAGRLQAWTPGELQLKYLRGAPGVSPEGGAHCVRLGPVSHVSYPPSNSHGLTHA